MRGLRGLIRWLTDPSPRLWESKLIGDLLKTSPEGREPVQTDMGDPLSHWLWKQAWDACAETGNWDLLTASAGIARAIRTDGLPLADGLTATAVRYRGSE